MNFTDFQPMYDFSLIEAAVQKFFATVDGTFFVSPPDDSDATRESWLPGADVAFYTSFQELTFQQARPRVRIRLHNVNHVAKAYVIDPNGTVREKAWTASMDFGIVTLPNYTKHAQLRSAVLSIISQVTPTITADNSTFSTTGINPLLTVHEVSEFWMRNVSTDVTPMEGVYLSQIPVQLAFNVKTSAWPAGMQIV